MLLLTEPSTILRHLQRGPFLACPSSWERNSWGQDSSLFRSYSESRDPRTPCPNDPEGASKTHAGPIPMCLIESG